jgi:imidazolonepropionase-like amidohydrolase
MTSALFPGSDFMTTLFLTAERLFDGSGGPTLVRPFVQVDGDRVAAVERTLLPPAACAGERCDFPGCTILPGLIDTHVHLAFGALDTNAAIIAQVTAATDDELLDRATANARAALHAGLTTVRDCGGRNRVVQTLRDRIRAGQVEGPDVLGCGMPITTTLGHCHWLGLIADSPDEVRRAAERMLAEDADFLKIMATGGNMTPTSDPMRAQYDDATLLLLADLGRRAGKFTAAHVLSRAALPGAVAARVRTVEHCDWRTRVDHYEFDVDLAKRLLDQQQYVGLTMSGTTRRSCSPQAAALDDGPARRLDQRFVCERRMIDFGVRYTLHSDAGVRLTPIERFDLGLIAAVRELRLTPAEVLRAVTATAAEAIGLTDRGVLTVGKRADLVVVEGNPLEDIACIGRVKAVLKAGRWIVKPEGAVRPMYKGEVHT